MILDQATNATLETQNLGNAREHETTLTKIHETHPAAARGSHHAASSSLNPNQATFAQFHRRCFRIAAMLHDGQSEFLSAYIAANLHRRSRPVAIPQQSVRPKPRMSPTRKVISPCKIAAKKTPPYSRHPEKSGRRRAIAMMQRIGEKIRSLLTNRPVYAISVRCRGADHE